MNWPFGNAVDATRFVGKIGVVTVLYNSAAVLPDFLLSLDAQSHRNFIVYCIDNASRDGSADICANHDSRFVVIRNSENAGVARGNNQGIEAALRDGCDHILLINNDVEFGSRLFEDLLIGMTAHRADMVTPMTYYFEPKNRIWCAGGSFSPIYGMRGKHRGLDALDAGQFSADALVDYAPTCCVLIRGAVFSSVGLMDERYFVYWDDSDWMLRAKRKGAKLWYLAKPKLWHKVSSLTAGSNSDFCTRFGRRNNAYYHFKHLPCVVAAAFSIVYCTYFLACFLLPQKRCKARLSLRSWLEGIALYYRTRTDNQTGN